MRKTGIILALLTLSACENDLKDAPTRIDNSLQTIVKSDPLTNANSQQYAIPLGCKELKTLEGEWRQEMTTTTLKRGGNRSSKVQDYEGDSAFTNRFRLPKRSKNLTFDYEFNPTTCILNQTVAKVDLTLKILSVNELSDSTELMMVICKDEKCQSIEEDLKSYLVLRRIR